MKEIFLFWMGEPDERVNRQTKSLREKDFTVTIGPSKEEHEYLMQSVPFYRNSFNAKVFAYCSDVWRIYKLSITKGMYMDVGIEIGNKFSEKYDQIMQSETYVVRNNFAFIDGPVLASSVNNNKFFGECFEIFRNLPDRHIRTVFHIGEIITYVSKKYGVNNTWDQSIVNGIFVDVITNLRDKDTMYKVSTNSWKVDGNKGDGMVRTISNFNKRYTWPSSKYNSRLIKKHGINSVNVCHLKSTYKSSKNISERKELLNIYKNKGFIAPINRWLVW